MPELVTITRDQFNKVVSDNKPRFTAEDPECKLDWGIDWDDLAEGDETPWDWVHDLFSVVHSSPQLWEYYKIVCKLELTDDSITFDALNFDLINHVSCVLCEEYEIPGNELPCSLWKLFGLGGDDDVDYCGTHPSCGYGAIKLYLELTKA